MIGSWARDILTFVAAFLGFWILMYNLHCEEFPDAIGTWEGKGTQHLASLDWAEPWAKKDHTFFAEFIIHIENTQTDTQFVSEFNRFAANTNLGMQVDLAAGRGKDSEGDSSSALTGRTMRDNLLWLLRTYVNSAMIHDVSLPPRPDAITAAMGDLYSPLDEARQAQIQSLLNENHVCDANVSFERRKRELRKAFKEHCHPLDIWGRIMDKFVFDLYFVPGQASDPVVVLRHGSDVDTGLKLAGILQKEAYKMKGEAGDCLWSKSSVTIDLGTNGIKIK